MEKINKMLSGELQVASMGLRSFTEAMKKQNIKVIHIDWQPPAAGDTKMSSILDLLKSISS